MADVSGTSASTSSGVCRSGRFKRLDEMPINLDGFAFEDPEMGLIAFNSPYDPQPSLVVNANGTVLELDGVPTVDFDMIDIFIARHGIDATVVSEAAAISEVEFARMIVDQSMSREKVVRLARGMSPAKLMGVVALLNPVELQMAIAKMHVRRTPSNQAHVTNQLDDPLLLAADAATAVAFGFRELETTVPVLADAASNALALLIGSQVAAPGALVQCSIEEALELDLGMRGLTTYAETVSVYGTEQVFIEGDDTPWSKAFLCSAYASRGLKMRLTSGGGAEVLMGQAERKSTTYLEARCVALARAMGAQGVQNGGIDGMCVVSSVPNGVRALLAENLLVMLQDMESCSGHDGYISESPIRRAAHMMPILLAGSDFICSGMGSIVRYDNMFGCSLFGGEDLDDYLVLQRDWGVDGALRPVPEAKLLEIRDRAARAAQAVYRDLGLADFDDARVEAVVVANGSKDLPAGDETAATDAAAAILEEGITALDVVGSLARTGFAVEAERIMGMLKERVRGDYLQTAAVFDEEMRVLSKLTDPNDYCGPGTGYHLSPARAAEIASIRQQRSMEDLRDDQAKLADDAHVVELGESAIGTEAREVCIGLSPAFGNGLWATYTGIPVWTVLREICAGLEEEGCVARLVSVRSTIDLGMIGLVAARLAGSGIGVGLQAKGTALIHRRDLSPLANLELLSLAPLISKQMYRALGRNAGRHAKGLRPEPVRLPYFEIGMEARYHARTCALVAIERAACLPQAAPVDVRVER
jgi:propanediol dehydratase large subunit